MTDCAIAACTNPAVVQWNRRPTAAELAPLVAAEQTRRDGIVATADPLAAPPVFGDMPSATNTVIAVYACHAHGISLELAGFVHQSSCTAPNPASLPSCDCSPEPATQAAPVAPQLPAGW